jgi:hypothetical protein
MSRHWLYWNKNLIASWDPKKNKVFTTSDVEFEDSKPVNDPAISIDKNPTPIPTDPIPPANHSGPTRSLATTSDEVEDVDDWLETAQGYKLVAAVKSTQKAIGTLNSYKEALTSRHSDKLKEAMSKEIEKSKKWAAGAWSDDRTCLRARDLYREDGHSLRSP